MKVGLTLNFCDCIQVTKTKIWLWFHIYRTAYSLTTFLSQFSKDQSWSAFICKCSYYSLIHGLDMLNAGIKALGDHNIYISECKLGVCQFYLNLPFSKLLIRLHCVQGVCLFHVPVLNIIIMVNLSTPVFHITSHSTNLMTLIL